MKTRLNAIEHRAVSGIWLLGQDFEEISISEETYTWLWRNLYTICDKPRLVKMFWANSSQYIDFRLQSIVSNQEHNIEDDKVVERKIERQRFLEFHYALGGLLLYRKQYDTLNYILQYTQSQPPSYPLLPGTTTEIFQWFEFFSNEYRHGVPIDLKYYFPELDNLGNRRQVTSWICNYITILFLRQYTLNRYYTYQNFTAPPNLPDDILELSSWLDSVSFFEICLKNILSNRDLIRSLEFDEIIERRRENFSIFITNLRQSIRTKITQQRRSNVLSDQKIQNFYSNSNEIISRAFSTYNSIFIPKDDDHSRSEYKLNIKGERTLMSKSAFTDNDFENMNYDTVFAEAIVTNRISRLIPNAFFTARTKRYLFNKQNFIVALSKIIGDNNEIIIIGVNVSFQIKEILKTSKFKDIVLYIPSTDFRTQDTLFVLRKTDLPAIEHKDLEESQKASLQLNLINERLNLYASIIDINENSDIKKEWNLEGQPDNEDLKVQLSISFLSVIYWKNERRMVQIDIASEFREQGIQNDINDVELI